MLILVQVLSALAPGDWLAALNLQDTYFHSPVLQAHRRYLRFTVGQEHFQFAVFPFGLTSGPPDVHESDGGGCSTPSEVRGPSLSPTSMTGC